MSGGHGRTTNSARPPTSARNEARRRFAAMGMPCAICGKPIDYSLSFWVDPVDGKRKRHPYSFEVDHVVPLAQGGANSMDNYQPAHRICNQRAGDKRRKKGEQRQRPVCSRAW